MKIIGKGRDFTFIVEMNETELDRLRGYNGYSGSKPRELEVGATIDVARLFDALAKLRNLDVAPTLSRMQEAYKEISEALKEPVMPAMKRPDDKPALTVDRPDLIAGGETVKVPPHPLVIE